jgi:sugar phosphate isomerase/epimerase
MPMHPYAKRSLAAGALTALFAGAAALAAPTAASAAPAFSPVCAGIPAEKISFQIYSYSSWIDEIGLDAVLGELESVGIQNVELDGLRGQTAAQYRDLLDSHGISVSGSHGTVDPAQFDQALADALELGQPAIGAAFFPGPGAPLPFPPPTTTPTYDDLLTTAGLLDDLGERSVAAGVGKFYAHNHFWEFENEYPDPETGELKTGWQVIVENTDPDLVTFEIDVFWAAGAGQDVPALLERYGDRVSLLHMKDGVPSSELPADWQDGGEGVIDWPAILEAAEGHVDYYVLERDSAPATREFAEDSFSFFTCTELGEPLAAVDAPAPAAGSAVTVTGSGFTGGRAYALFLPGGTEQIGAATAAQDGTFTITGTLPADIAPGSYALEVRGLLGGTAAVTAAVVVTAPGVPAPAPSASTPALAATGSDAATLPLAIGAVLLVGAGAALVGTSVRRRAKVN